MHKERIIELLDELVDVAVESVRYVGTANYFEREDEALLWLESKRNEIIEKIEAYFKHHVNKGR